MYSISDLKIGTLVELDGVPHKVVSAQHNFVGRGGATMRTRVKNLLNGNVLEKTFRPADKISPASLSTRPAQFLYKEGSNYFFMDSQSFEQHQLASDVVGEKSQFMPEGSAVSLLTSGQKVLEVGLPNSVQLKAAQCDPGVKGDTATAAQKNCTLETGLKVNVPLFIKTGDVLKIDTRTGQYLERVK